MLEIVETIGKKHDKNNYNFSIIHTIVFYDVYFSCIPMFFFVAMQIFSVTLYFGRFSGSRLIVIIKCYKFNSFIARL